MKSLFRIALVLAKGLAVLLLLVVLALALVWLDYNDFYDADYKDLTEAQMAQFEWKDTYDDEGQQLQSAFIAQFKNKELEFPRQRVSKIKLFRNIPVIGIFTGKSLDNKQADLVLKFSNDPSNFDWGETTWTFWDPEYVLKFYSEGGSVIGKMFICMKGGGIIGARPFSPRMKLGQLSEKGERQLNQVILDIYGNH